VDIFREEILGVFGGNVPEAMKAKIDGYVRAFGAIDPSAIGLDGKTRSREDFRDIVTRSLARSPEVLQAQKSAVGDMIEEFAASESAALVPAETKGLVSLGEQLMQPGVTVSSETIASVHKAISDARARAEKKYEFRRMKARSIQSLEHMAMTPGLGTAQIRGIESLLARTHSAVSDDEISSVMEKATSIVSGSDPAEVLARNEKAQMFDALIKVMPKDIDVASAVDFARQVKEIVYGTSSGASVQEAAQTQAAPPGAASRGGSLAAQMGRDPSQLVTVRNTASTEAELGGEPVQEPPIDKRPSAEPDQYAMYQAATYVDDRTGEEISKAQQEYESKFGPINEAKKKLVASEIERRDAKRAKKEREAADEAAADAAEKKEAEEAEARRGDFATVAALALWVRSGKKTRKQLDDAVAEFKKKYGELTNEEQNRLTRNSR
jgi:hypothetical protein